MDKDIHPEITRLKRQAKALKKHMPDLSLCRIQHLIAQQHGFKSWTALRNSVLGGDNGS